MEPVRVELTTNYASNPVLEWFHCINIVKSFGVFKGFGCITYGMTCQMVPLLKVIVPFLVTLGVSALNANIYMASSGVMFVPGHNSIALLELFCSTK